MRQHEKARYEYRVFATNLQATAARLATEAHISTSESSDETYIASRLNIDSNVKLRGSQLEVKILRGREILFELWEPTLQAELPVDVEIFLEQVAPCLGVQIDLVSGGVLSAGEIMSIVERTPSVALIPVHKERTKYIHEMGLSEFVDLSTPGWRFQSVAVESGDIESARQLLQLADIASLTNESYPAFLQRQAFS
ncbi:MAG: hypothetical protein APF80_00215 [Alphaproteobacteria bacterium BRH_c36]|nr:MAG: hypothetical protein APF80_00215 [Alphaproteobacteria bacterium BRH_c36]